MVPLPGTGSWITRYAKIRTHKIRHAVTAICQQRLHAAPCIRHSAFMELQLFLSMLPALSPPMRPMQPLRILFFFLILALVLAFTIVVCEYFVFDAMSVKFHSAEHLKNLPASDFIGCPPLPNVTSSFIAAPAVVLDGGQAFKKFRACPRLDSAAIQFANSKGFFITEISETVMGTGFVAASCKPQGWNYSFVYPRYDRRSNEWLSKAFKSIMGDGLAPLCGYDWDQKLHDLFKTDDCDLIVDVGGNIGLSVSPALSRNYRVLVFEPIPVNVELLRTNLWVNGWDVDQVGLVAAGVSSSSGKATIFAPIGQEDNAALKSADVATLTVGGSAASININLISLDDYFDSADPSLRDKVRLVKIDAQGHELPILQGMKKMLSSGHRRFALIVEVHVGLQVAAGYGPKDIENYMLSLGWNAFCGGELVPGSSCLDVVFVHESRVAEARLRT